MNQNVTVPNKASEIIAFVSDYFDKMPPYSRVTFEDLVPFVATKCKKAAHHMVRAYIHTVIKHREDLVVHRGRGICKR